MWNSRIGIDKANPPKEIAQLIDQDTLLGKCVYSHYK